jgi:hypothetical protein
MNLLLAIYGALGAPALVSLAVLAALLFTPVAPFCGDLKGLRGMRRLAVAWTPALLAALFLFATRVVPTYSAKSPERVNFQYVRNADSGMASWVVQAESGRLPEPIRLATRFRRAENGYFPWDTKTAFVADAPHTDLAAPTFTLLESSENNGRRLYRALLRSERGAPVATVLFPPGADVQSVVMGGIPQQAQTQRMRTYRHHWTGYSCATMPAAGVEISFLVPQGKTIEVFALDESYELPPEGAFLLHARPLTARPSQSGDVTIVFRHVQLLP